MVKHIVCWKLKDFAEGRHRSENALLVKDRLLEMKAHLPGVLSMEVGINSELASVENYDIALTMEFDSFADLNAYQSHPEHLKFVEFIRKVRDLRVAVDYPEED